jgi:hypothetical protein
MTYKELLDSIILKDVLDNPTSLININLNDVKDLFRQNEDICAFDVKVNSNEEQRMELLMKQIKERTKSNHFSSALIFFLFPESHPLLMSEIQPLSEWIESAPGEFLLTWGMATQSSQELRIIVLLQ